MKRILATILAALMILGAAATGAAAAPVLQEGELIEDLSTAQQADLRNQVANFTKYMDRVQVERAVALVFALEASQGVPEALKDPSKEAEFNAAVAAALGNVDMVFADAYDELIKAFVADSEAVIVAAYLAGNLQARLRELFAAYLTNFINQIQPLVDTYVKQEIINNAKEYAKLATLPWIIQDSSLRAELKADLKAKLLQLRKSIDVKALIRKSAAEFAKAIDNLVLDSRKALAAAKLLKLEWQEKLPAMLRNANKILQWIYYYLLFGWLVAVFS